jgi:hypothetical protein
MSYIFVSKQASIEAEAFDLFHEFVHATFFLNGKYANADYSRTSQEIDAVRGENQVRRELHRDARTRYSGKDVPEPETASLPEERNDKWGCSCP